MISPVHSLGPGERVCLWTRGCGKACPGCIAPELWEHSGPQVDEALLARLLRETARRDGCRGLTISGGDPMEQSGALLRLLRCVREDFTDILVYTGWTLEELRAGAAGAAGLACLELIDVLADGRYEREKNRPDCVLRGSENQRLHFLNPALEPSYRDYMARGRILESFTHGDTLIVTGIPDRRMEE